MRSKVAVITGGAGGIGSACVRAFGRAGYRVALVYNRSEEKASSIVRELREQGIDAECFRADLRSFGETREMSEAVLRRFGRVDVLVNNAGISLIKLFTDLTEEEWDDMIDSDLKSVFNCCRHFLPGMIAEKSGSIINISSMWGQQGASCEVAYSAAKAGVIGLTKALAQEVGLSGIRVNCVAPGVIDTDMNSELTPEDMDALREEIPLAEIGVPEDVAKACLFLATEDASYITGQVIGVNGGMVL